MELREINVLVVDDSKVMRRIITQHLHSMGGQHVYEASSGREALSVLAEKNVDLILSDWSMPGLSGLDLLNEVRRQGALQNIPFILLTAEAQLYTILLAFESNVSSYVTKPFTPDYFKYVVHRVLKENYVGPCEV